MIRWVVKYRVAMGWVLAVVVIYLASPTPRSLVTGLPLALIGLFIRAVAAGTIMKGSVLARDGVYSLTRNPLYLGSFILAVAFGVMCGALICTLLLVLVSAAVFPATIHSEETELHDRFGSDFEAFRAAVPCFVPHRLSWHVLEHFSFRQFVANREYNATIGFLGATGILTAKYLLTVA